MIPHVLAFTLGVCWLQTAATLPDWRVFLAAGIAFGLLAAWIQRIRTQDATRRCLRLLALSAAAALLGVSWSAWRAELRLEDHLPTAWEGRDIEVIGIVASLPHSFERGIRSVFEVESVLTPGAVAPRRVNLSWYHPDPEDRRRANPLDIAMSPEWSAGERWHLTLRLKRPHGNANPHGFDYEAWLLERNIRAVGYVRPASSKTDGPQKLEAMVWQPAYIIERIRQKLRKRFFNALPTEHYAYTSVLAALAMGDQRGISNDMWRTFRRSGVVHLLSVSGLHVTMVAALFGLLVSALWRRVPTLPLRVATPRAAIVSGWAIALIYSLLAGFAVPTQRTLYMLSVAALALLLGRNLGASRTLTFALLVVLLIDPWAVLSPGFWLSFGAVAALFYVSASRVASRQAEQRTWGDRIKRTIGTWGLSQWSATLASLPVLLLLFSQFSLVSPLANALAIPWISLLITPLALTTALLPWTPLLQLSHALLSPLMQLLEWCAQAPLWEAPSPPGWALAAAILGVALLLLPRVVSGRSFGVFLLLPVLFWRPMPFSPGEFRVTMLDVGQGIAAAIETAQGITLYDTGPRYSRTANAGERVVLPWLLARGVRSIDTLIVTHRDSDHAGGFRSLYEALPVRRVISSVSSLPGERCIAGQSWEEAGVHFQMLYPTLEDYARGTEHKKNHLSCVLKVSGPGGALLLTSDITVADEERLLERSESLEAEVLSVPHHGSRSSSLPQFIEATGAKHALLSVGYRNRYRHPHPQVLERYHRQRLWRTDLQGAIRVDFGRSGYRLNAWRESHRRYWYGR